VKKEELSLDAVKQFKVHVPDELEKIEVIKDYIFEIGENLGQTIIFVRTKSSAKMLHKALVDLGYEVTSIHGNLEHDERDKIVKEFKDGLTQVLISTDVLARGFDQQQVLIWFLSVSVIPSRVFGLICFFMHPSIVLFRLIWLSIMIFQ
jgi:ATP-dependent RNA helicase DDX19/DBP5